MLPRMAAQKKAPTKSSGGQTGKKAPAPLAKRKSISSRRRQQLIEAKRRQRERDRVAGQAFYQVKLPADKIEKLKQGMNDPAFVERLTQLLDDSYPD